MEVSSSNPSDGLNEAPSSGHQQDPHDDESQGGRAETSGSPMNESQHSISNFKSASNHSTSFLLASSSHTVGNSDGIVKRSGSERKLLDGSSHGQGTPGDVELPSHMVTSQQESRLAYPNAMQGGGKIAKASAERLVELDTQNMQEYVVSRRMDPVPKLRPVPVDRLIRRIPQNGLPEGNNQSGDVCMPSRMVGTRSTNPSSSSSGSQRLRGGKVEKASALSFVERDVENLQELVVSTMAEPRPPPPQLSQPGAFAQPGPPPLFDSSSLRFTNVGTQEEDNDDSFPELVHGMSVALPVTMAPEEAEPVDPKGQANKKSSYPMKELLCGLLVLVVVAAGFVAILVASHTSNDIGDHQELADNGSWNETEASTNTVLDLPVTLLESTMHVILHDNERTSPQSKAYQWLRNDPYLMNYTEERLLQRFATVTFYYSTGGEDWLEQGGGTISVRIDSGPPGANRRLQPPPRPPPPPGAERPTIQYMNITSAKWLSYGIPECAWFSLASVENKQACNDDGSFRNLYMLANNLTGTLPVELEMLTSLGGIKVGRNRIAGTIPTQIGRMTRLQQLRLFDNDLTGTIPSEIGVLSDTLEGVSLLGNELTGSLPEQFWQLSHLDDILLSRNSLSGSIVDDIGHRMPKLGVFQVGGNEFTGSIPSSLGLCEDLKVVHVDKNQLQGRIPSELGQRVLLHRLFLQDNELSGSVPSELGLLTGLREMRLSNNPLINGSFPEELSQLNASAHGLLLEGTAITGTIPEGLCDLHRLSFDCSESLCGCDCPCS